MVDIKATPTDTPPTHHFSFELGSDLIGAIAVSMGKDGSLSPNFMAAKMSPFERSTLEVNQGSGPLAEKRKPFGEFGITTWIGGLGQEEGEKDATAYWFGKNVWTLADGKLMLGPKILDTEVTSTLDNTGSASGSFLLRTIDDTHYTYLEWLVTATQTGGKIIDKVTVSAEGAGVLTLEAYRNNQGVPSTVINTFSLDIDSPSVYTDITFDMNLSADVWFRLRGENISVQLKTNATYTSQETTHLYYLYQPAPIQDGSQALNIWKSGGADPTKNHYVDQFIEYNPTSSFNKISITARVGESSGVSNYNKVTVFLRKGSPTVFASFPNRPTLIEQWDLTLTTSFVAYSHTLAATQDPNDTYWIEIIPYNQTAGSDEENFYTPMGLYTGDSLQIWFGSIYQDGVLRDFWRPLKDSTHIPTVKIEFVSPGDGDRLSCAPPIFTVRLAATVGDTYGRFYEYRSALYFITTPAAGKSRLYMNCDRGACDSNAGSQERLIDASKTWTVNEWTGCLVKIIEGPGVGEWRKIVSNTATALVVGIGGANYWDTAHTTASGYVIVGRNKWTEITDANFVNNVILARDVCISNTDVGYIAQGQVANILRFREYNNAGSWTRDYAVDGSNKADLLAFAWDQDKGSIIYRAINTVTPTVGLATVKDWGTNLTFDTADDVKIGGRSAIRGMIPYDDQLAITKNDSIWMLKGKAPEKLSIDMTSQYEDFTGKNPQVYSPYLVFPYGNGIERLVGQIVEEFAPSMAIGYSGQFVDSLSIPGAIIAARRGIKITASPTASMIMLWRNGFWHPLYAIDGSIQVEDVYYQRLDSGEDLLWFSSENGVMGMRFPREFDYLKDPAFIENGVDCSSNGYVVTGWFNAGSKRLAKYWSSIYLAMDQYTVGAGGGAKVDVFYQTQRYKSDTNEADWTLAGSLTASGSIDINAEAREIRFMIKLSGNPNSVPIVYGYNVNYLGRVETGMSWSIPLVIEDYPQTLDGQTEDLTALQIYDIYRRMSQSITPITMRSISTIYDNTQVLLDLAPLAPLFIDPEVDPGEGQSREKYLSSLVIYGA